MIYVDTSVSLAELSGMLRFLVPLSGAVILLVAYTRWPMEALYTLAIYVAFYDSIGFQIPNIKQIDELSVALILPIAPPPSGWASSRAWSPTSRPRSGCQPLRWRSRPSSSSTWCSGRASRHGRLRRPRASRWCWAW